MRSLTVNNGKAIGNGSNGTGHRPRVGAPRWPGGGFVVTGRGDGVLRTRSARGPEPDADRGARCLHRCAAPHPRQRWPGTQPPPPIAPAGTPVSVHEI